MSDFDSGFSNEPGFDSSNLEEDIKKYREIIENGGLYNSIEPIEDLIQHCQDDDYYDDALFFIDRLLEVFPYNSE
ncbi:MAG TPA: hypothetical protein VLN45_07100, partial [Ignavibacteriaceae bacterium]|nr:hypothetical protein [Ignavibacteriaceae bacterium]